MYLKIPILKSLKKEKPWLGWIGRVGGRRKREGIWGYMYTYS